MHIAPEVDEDTLTEMYETGRREGPEVRGPADHGFVCSIYLRDPKGLRYGADVKQSNPEREMDPATTGAREKTRNRSRMLSQFLELERERVGWRFWVL